MPKIIEKVEVWKETKNGGQSFFFTGEVIEADDPEFLEIHTLRGEDLKFRKDQFLQRTVISKE